MSVYISTQVVRGYSAEGAYLGEIVLLRETTFACRFDQLSCGWANGASSLLEVRIYLFVVEVELPIFISCWTFSRSGVAGLSDLSVCTIERGQYVVES